MGNLYLICTFLNKQTTHCDIIVISWYIFFIFVSFYYNFIQFSSTKVFIFCFVVYPECYYYEVFIEKSKNFYFSIGDSIKNWCSGFYFSHFSCGLPHLGCGWAHFDPVKFKLFLWFTTLLVIIGDYYTKTSPLFILFKIVSSSYILMPGFPLAFGK